MPIGSKRFIPRILLRSLHRIGFLLAMVSWPGYPPAAIPSSTIAWLLAILLLPPYVGVPLYIMFGGRKVAGWHTVKRRFHQRSAVPSGGGPDGAVERLLASYGVSPPSAGNCLELPVVWGEAYERILARHREAAQLEAFTSRPIFSGDDKEAATWSNASRGRRAKASPCACSWTAWARGGQAAVLADLIAAGGEVVSFMPVLKRVLAGTQLEEPPEARDCGFPGGFDRRHESGSACVGPPVRSGSGKTSPSSSKGLRVTDLDSLFRVGLEARNRPGPRSPRSSDYPICATGFESTTVQVVATALDVAGDSALRIVARLDLFGQTRIWIVTPYYVPDEMLGPRLGLAARRGVDVRVDRARAIQTTSPADLARASYLRDLHTAGGRISPLQAGHASRGGRPLRRSPGRHRLGEHGYAQPLPQLEVALFAYSPNQVDRVADVGRTTHGRLEARLPRPAGLARSPKMSVRPTLAAALTPT